MNDYKYLGKNPQRKKDRRVDYVYYLKPLWEQSTGTKTAAVLKPLAERGIFSTGKSYLDRTGGMFMRIVSKTWMVVLGVTLINFILNFFFMLLLFQLMERRSYLISFILLVIAIGSQFCFLSSLTVDFRSFLRWFVKPEQLNNIKEREEDDNSHC